MFFDDPSKTGSIEITIDVLNRALKRLNEHDYTSAQVMVAVARQMLEDLQTDFDRHLQVESMLKQLLE